MNKMLGEFHSWTIINEQIAIKKCDTSCIRYNESGIPQEIRWFFDVEDMYIGEKRYIKIKIDDRIHSAYFTLKKGEPPRSAIRWDKSFSKELEREYMKFKEFPSIEFKRDSYENFYIKIYNK